MEMPAEFCTLFFNSRRHFIFYYLVLVCFDLIYLNSERVC
jgi:hypothetical protein